MIKSSFWFPLFYCLFLLICIFYPSVSFGGGLQVRHYMIVLMFVLLLILQKGRLQVDWFMLLYGLFMFFYFVSGVLTGYIEEHLNKLLGTYLSALVMYMATKVMILQYDKIKMISWVLLLIFLADAIITIGQYYQIPQLVAFPDFVGIKIDEDFTEVIEEELTMEGRPIEGLVGAVMNGYILSIATILAWYPFKNKRVYLNVVFWSICMVGSFLAQERSGFFLAILCTCGLVFFRFRSRSGLAIILLLGALVLMFVLGPSLFDYLFSHGRYQMGLEGGRQLRIMHGTDFFIDHPLGGDFLYNEMRMSRPHNLFINMLVVGGIFGGLCLFAIVARQLFLICRFIIRDKKATNWIPLLYGMMYLNLTANSLVHNASIVYGSVLFFVIWGVVACYMDPSMKPKTQNSRSYVK